MKKVSVILTTYNGEKSVERTINSILNQNGINKEFVLELIVVDDCSTDNTIEIVNKFDILLLSTIRNSGGPNAGRNIGLKHATGDYIMIADQDDVWKEHRLISLIPHLKKVPVVSSGYTIYDISKKNKIERVKHHNSGFVYYGKNKTFINKLTKSLKGQNTYLGSIIFKKNLKGILFEEHFGMVDYDWILNIFYQNDSVEVCDSLYSRYVESNNLSLNEYYRKVDFYYSLFCIENYEREFPGEVRIAYKRIHGTRARYYYLKGNMKKARYYFLRSEISLKTIIFYLTTFAGSKIVIKKFNVFG
jgi:glycosyltransferase involved in cell wall biosynthesis